MAAIPSRGSERQERKALAEQRIRAALRAVGPAGAMRLALRREVATLPDAKGVAATVMTTIGDDLVLHLISGGLSASLPLPTPSVTLEDECNVTATLLRDLSNNDRFELLAASGDHDRLDAHERQRVDVRHGLLTH